MTATVDSILKALSDEGVVLRLFATFSRFEYALKRAGYLKPQERAEADWDAFAKGIRWKTPVHPTVQEATSYLLSEPPQRQVAVGDSYQSLEWKSVDRSPRTSDEEFVLQLVRIVRNNLFHGGKFPPPIGPLADSTRNRRLMEACITVLEQCLSQNSKVRSFFLETA